MNQKSRLLAACVPMLMSVSAVADVYTNPRPVITIANGKLQGVESNGMVSFKNIPYAASPTGDLRWRPPQPARNWDGVRDASRFGEACIQPLIQGLNNELVPGTEDCLKLNVFAPKSAKNLPVMVWFHGGGLLEGSAIEPYYKPVGLVRHGVVVVSVDYRLGKFGFFAPKELSEEARRNQEPVGNYGTMDQIHSLKWVKENIAAFGGDPDNVTIFGQSAGGRSVTWLMTSPAAKGLFHKAIAQSPQQLPMRDQTKEKLGMPAEETADAKYMETLGVKTLAELRALPAEKLMITPLEFQEGEFGGAFVDGQILVGDPIPLFAAGKQHKVPFMIGTNSWDASYFVLGQQPVEAYVKKMGEDPKVIEGLYASFKETCVLSAEIMADGWYKGAVKLLADSANQAAPSYAYYYDFLTPNIRASHIGAPHTFELPYVFGDLSTVPRAPATPDPGGNICDHIGKAVTDIRQKATWARYWFPAVDPAGKEDQSISEQLTKSWTAFARTGNPNPDGTQDWPRYNLKDDVMRNFTQGTQGVIKNLAKDRVDYQMKAIRAIYQVAP